MLEPDETKRSGLPFRLRSNLAPRRLPGDERAIRVEVDLRHLGLKFSTSVSYDRRVATSTRTDVYGVLTAWLGTISFLAAFGSAPAADHVTAAATAPLNSTAVMVLLTPVTRPF